MSGPDPDTSAERAEAEPSDASADAVERIRAIFDHGLQFTCILSPDGTLLEANPAALAFAGLRREDALGRPLWETLWWTSEPEEGRERLREAVRRVAGGGVARHELAAANARGEAAMLDFSLCAVPDGDGGVRAIVAEARDITAFYEAREALRASEATLSAILSGTLDAIVSVDEEQRIRLFNQGAERIFGWSADEVLGEPLGLLIPENFRQAHRSDVESFGKSSDAARRMGERGEIVGRRKDGDLFPAEASISKAEVAGDRMYTAILRDITERRRTERERARLAEAEREARLEAEAATRARDDMLRVVSHDLRNPVTGVMMGAKMLRFQLDPDHPGREILEGIELAAERQTRLIRDLSDVANIEAGRLSIERRPHRVAALLRLAARQFEPVARTRGVAFDCEPDVDLPPVLADRDRIVQVLANLLDNAMQATAAGGRVKVDARRVDGAVRFTVSDTGPGIAEDELDRIFDRFWRGSSRSRAGTGLGLAIARGIVEGHEGEIAVESKLGEGTAVYFDLPVVERTAS